MTMTLSFPQALTVNHHQSNIPTDSSMGEVSFSVATVCLMRAKCKQVSPSSSWTLMLALERTRSSISAEWPWDTASSRGVCCRLLRMSTSARFCSKKFVGNNPLVFTLLLRSVPYWQIMCRSKMMVRNCIPETHFSPVLTVDVYRMEIWQVTRKHTLTKNCQSK